MTTSTLSNSDPAPNHLKGLLRHFADLRDGIHGNGAVTRTDKEHLFSSAVDYIDRYARQALSEMNDALLLGSGTIIATGVTTFPNGDVAANWTLGWPEQELAGIPPITLQAFYGQGFHHPHPRGGTVRDWPLNIFSDDDVAAELSTLRAIAATELHNLVFQRDYRIIPATTRPMIEAEPN